MSAVGFPTGEMYQDRFHSWQVKWGTSWKIAWPEQAFALKSINGMGLDLIFPIHPILILKRHSDLPCGPVTLSHRLRQPELMDDPDLPEAEHDAALDGLARLNAWSMADLPFRAPILQLLPPDQSQVTILDLAAGSGDLVIRLAQTLPGGLQRIQWQVADISEHALDRCRRRASEAGVEIETHRVNAVEDELPPADIVTCSLFLHHLQEDDVVAVLRNLQTSARLGGVVCDLRRSRTGFLLAAAASRLATRSHVVHFDATASVRAAFTIDELRKLTVAAAMTDARIQAVFPQRMRITWPGQEMTT